jgi:hypothetical protein
MRSVRIGLSILAIAAAAAAGCGDDDVTPPRATGFEVSATNLPALPAGKGHYEAWLAYPLPDEGKANGAGAKALHGDLELISIGKFRVGASGALLELDGTPAQWALALDRGLNPDQAWISIEPEGDTDTIPQGLVLAGFVTGSPTRGVATLTHGFRAVYDLEDDDANLAAFMGHYVLETPSDTVSTNEANGLYFRDGAEHGLELPDLDGEKVVYEGWVANLAGDSLRSTGRFTTVHGFDSDTTGFGGGGLPPDSLPGQEFVTGTPLVLNDGNRRVLVSMEPAVDNDASAPSPFVLLRATIAAGQTTGVAAPMQNVTASLPTATIVINR